MSRKCFIENCGSEWFSGSSKVFHKFPQDRERIDQWIECIKDDRLHGYTVEQLKSIYICGRHFEESCYSSTSGSRRLVSRAVPTIFTARKNLARKSTGGISRKAKSTDNKEVSNLLAISDDTASQCMESLSLSGVGKLKLSREIRCLGFDNPGPQTAILNDLSRRERRKKTQVPEVVEISSKIRGCPEYDELGIYLASGSDICDCLIPSCSGCFFPCPDCTSAKCGPVCRRSRTWHYDSIAIEGTNIARKFTA